MPVPFRKQDDGSSSASGSGDSPTSTSAKLPNTFFEEQSISSRHNDSTHSPDIEIGISIPEQSDGSGGPIQSVEPLDYQPRGYRGPPPPSTSSERINSMPEPEEYAELYTRNALETFRFGSASISTMTDTSSVDPLSLSNDDFQPPAIDTLPLPSLAVHTEGARSQPSQMTSPSDRTPTANCQPMQNNSTFRTFQPTSASPSGSPIVRPIDQSPRFRPKTSQKLSSNDGPGVRCHSPPDVECPHPPTDETSFFDEYHVVDDGEFSDVDFEIISSQLDHSSSFDISPSEEDIFREPHLSQRRGINPIPIPGTQAGPSRGRDGESSVATVKSLANNQEAWWPFAPHEDRRPSVASTINDEFQKHALAYKDQDWSFQRDKSDDGPIPKPKRNVFIPFSERPPKRGPPWRGMTLGDVEYWRNELTGIYKVERTEVNASDTKPPQQRLAIHHSRDGVRQGSQSMPGNFRDRYSGPHTTVHKHSKAPAFSLSRHYRDKSHSKSSDRGKSSKIQPLRNAVYINGQKTRMILLAPRKVQEQYTSTATTRKLESHGLLDDPHCKNDQDRYKRLADEDEKQRLKEQSKRERELEKKAKKDRGKAKSKGSETTPRTIETSPLATKSNTVSPSCASTTQVEPGAAQDPCPRGAIRKATSAASLTVPTMRYTKSSNSSVTVAIAQGMVSTQVSTPATESLQYLSTSGTTSPPPPEVSQPQSPALQIQQSLSASSGATAVPHHHRYEYDHDDEEDEIDETKEIRPAFRRRKHTPHNEVYHSLSPESIDSFANQPDNHSRGLFSLISRNSSKRTLACHDVPYDPPWLSAPSRPNNHGLQMQVVAGLKHPFQSVGVVLTEKMREIRLRRAKKQALDDNRTESQYTKEKDVFIGLPDEAPYMLVPLWPSETDPVSAKEHPFKMPELESAKRLYVVIYYKPWPDSAKKKGKEKGRKRLSPSSFEGFYMDDRNVLMTQFYIGARVVTYDDLEGSNIRVPELGLSVMGPLQEAFDSAPVNNKEINEPDKKGKGEERTETKSFWDFIIGTYYSRDHAIEFYPEGFKKMALATQEFPTSNNTSTSSLASVSSSAGGAASAGSANTGPGAPSDCQHPINCEEELIEEAPIILTPMGRAVMEMAFMGAMAVTGFTPE